MSPGASRSSVSPYAALAALLFVLNAVFLWVNFQTVRNHQEILKHTHDVTHELDMVLFSAKEAEAGLRGFLLTKDPAHLELYHHGRIQIWDHFHRVSFLTIENAEQTASLKAMEEALRSRLMTLDTIAKVFEKDLNLKNVPQSYFKASQSSMLVLESQVEKIKGVEEQALAARSEKVKQSQFQFYLTLVLTTLLSIVLIGWALNQVWKNQIQAELETQEQSKQSEMKQKVVQLSQALSKPLHTVEVAQEVLDHLGKLVTLGAANFYLIDGKKMRRLASFAESPSVTAGTLEMGQTLLGEAAKRTEMTEIQNVPEDYFPISSSLGKSTPRVLTFVPILYEKEPCAILELASFETLTASDKALLNQLLSVIGNGINSALWRERVEKLLSTTQVQANELQTQQEELRTSNEELAQQAEELQTQQEELRTTNEELEQQARILESQQKIVNEKNAELEKRAADLTRANQYKSEFLAKMSHELRTPLNSLLILASLLVENREKNLSSQQKEFAQSIYGAGHELLGLINDILDLSKIEAQKLSLRPENFTVQSLADHLHKTFEIQTQSKGLEFTVQVESEIAQQVMWSDRQRIEQVLRNFLSNALKFTEKGAIRFQARPGSQAQWIQFVVEDSGIGIPENKRDLIFEAFEQADSSVSRRYGGTGLGLTISKELAQFLGGKVGLESEEGKGSRFVLEIPMRIPDISEERLALEEKPVEKKLATEALPVNASTEATAEAIKAIERASQDRRALLLIEDDAQLRQKVAKMARQHQFEPLEVSSAEAALEVVQRRIPSAIFLDASLPGMSGMAFLEFLKEKPQLRNVPVHVVSATNLEEPVLRMGAAGYSEKPDTEQQLDQILKHIEEVAAKKVHRILVVEDNDRQREAILHLISGRDVDISCVGHGDEALKRLQNEVFDCVVLDLELPDVSGFDILAKLHSFKTSLPPVVIYTGREISEAEEQKLRRFSDSIIIKGARSPERLLDQVNLFLHRSDSDVPEDSRQVLEDLRKHDDFFRGHTVLLVDDDLRNVFSLTNALESWGMNVRIARNGQEALELLEENQEIEFVLMDLMMPVMDGFEAMKRIRSRKKYQELPIVALTAKSAKECHSKCLEAGANDYLPKPIELANLRSVLKVWLQSPRIFS